MVRARLLPGCSSGSSWIALLCAVWFGGRAPQGCGTFADREAAVAGGPQLGLGLGLLVRHTCVCLAACEDGRFVLQISDTMPALLHPEEAPP